MRALVCLLASACFSLGCQAAPKPCCHRASTGYLPIEEMVGMLSVQVRAEQFEGVRKIGDRILPSPDARFPDGRWVLPVFYDALDDGLSRAATGEADWTRYEQALTAMTERRPDSSTAWLMLATLHLSHAWSVRGGGTIDTVDDASLARFRALLARARALLDQHKEALVSNPQWYAMRLDIGGASSESRANVQAIFDEGVQRWPAYQPIWLTRLHYLAPKWGGSTAQMVDLVARAGRTPTETDGVGLVARLLWAADRDDALDLVRQPGIDWPLVKKSQDDVLDRYPDNVNVQLAVLEACHRPDKPETARLLARMENAPDFMTLGSRLDLFQQCIAWANDKRPDARAPEGLVSPGR